MGECIIGRYGSSGDAGISNETKASLGLPNNATIDDVIEILALKDDNYATIMVTVLDPDGSIVPGASVSMNDGQSIINYTTNSAGKCLFKTNTGTANIKEVNIEYYDLLEDQKIVDCPVGSVHSINLIRTIRGNGYSEKFTYNRNFKFSRFLNTINVGIYSASGSGGAATGTFNYNARSPSGPGIYSGYSITQSNKNFINYPGDHGNKIHSTISIESDKIYEMGIGVRGNFGSRTTVLNTFGWLDNGTVYNTYWTNGSRTIPVPSFNGNSGGTSYFGNISVPGGSGGSISTIYNSNANEIIGGNSTTDIRSNWLTASNYQSRYYTLILYEYGGYGNNGYIWLNNFQYKI